MKVSIIIPFYNVEAYIADCLQSVMRQTYTGSMECVLVNDCSTDWSVALAEQLIADYAGPIAFQIVHHERNRGVAAARNTGMDASTGEYIFFLDSDDWISDDCIEKLAKPLQEKKLDIVIGDYESIGEPPCSLKLSLSEGQYHEKGITKTFCDCGVYVMVWNKLYLRDFLYNNQLRFEEVKIYEDEIWTFDFSCIEKFFYVVKSVTYFYRIRENSIMTGSDQMKRIVGRIQLLQSMKEKVRHYKNVKGIYDFYFFWVRRVFRWISKYEMNEEMLRYVQDHTRDCFEVIPGVCYLHNKHDRLTYFACRKDQSYKRFQYVTKEYSESVQGRIFRNVLNLLPAKG